VGESHFVGRPNHSNRCRKACRAAFALFALFWLGSCDALNPAFVSLIAPGEANTFTTLDPAPGHLVIAFVNNAEVDEQLISYLEGPGGLSLTDAERRAVRPRIRARVQVTFLNGEQTQFELVDGTQNLIDQRFAAQSVPDLNQNDLDNAVVLCNVSRVELQLNTLEVFIPTQLEIWELVDVISGQGVTTSSFRLRGQTPPAFRQLQMDTVDEDGNTILLRNIGIRDVPAPVIGPNCGTVVTITMNGTLAVPFLTGPGVEGNNPSYDRDDPQSEASIGGRFEFIVSQL